MAIYRIEGKWHRANGKICECGKIPPAMEDFDFKNDYFILGNFDEGAPKPPPRKDFCEECFNFNKE